MTVHLVVGLPGSGKTRLGRELAKSTNSVLVDDSSAFDQNLLDEYTMMSKPIVFVCPYLCDGQYIASAIRFFEKRKYQVVRHYFANSPGQCISNLRHRKPESVKHIEPIVHHLSHIYNPPLDAIPVFVASSSSIA